MHTRFVDLFLPNYWTSQLVKCMVTHMNPISGRRG